MRPGYEIASAAEYKDAAWPNIMAAMGVVKIREAGDEIIGRRRRRRMAMGCGQWPARTTPMKTRIGTNRIIVY